jgi:hypothetical protein
MRNEQLRRRRKLARKQAIRDGRIAAPKKKVETGRKGASSSNAPARAPRF